MDANQLDKQLEQQQIELGGTIRKLSRAGQPTDELEAREWAVREQRIAIQDAQFILMSPEQRQAYYTSGGFIPTGDPEQFTDAGVKAWFDGVGCGRWDRAQKLITDGVVK